MKKASLYEEELALFLKDKSTMNFLVELVNALPNIIAILNEERKLVYTNQATLDRVSIPNFESAFHMKPGDLFKCVNSDVGLDGCGSSKACQLCGALNALKRAADEAMEVTEDCRILSKIDGLNNAYTFKFTASPFKTGGNLFFVVTIEDRSEEQRKTEMERIFYHDVLNSLTGLGGVIRILKENESIEPIHLQILKNAYRNLSITINEQREISQAERGELLVNKRLINSKNIIHDIVMPFKENQSYIATLEVSDQTVDRSFVSDPTLCSRVLTNMVKNALEASGKGETVSIGVREDNQYLTFWVHNPSYIPRKIQLQIFERSFTTKGVGRGLGTFSMKLIGENYLGGEIDFTSKKEEGTTFTFSIPI